jgi:DNA-binding response OmpR family regulator
MPKVLIIDDEPFTVEMLQTFLQINGYEAIGALTGQDGIILTQVESPDIVLLDLMLPDIDGYDVCRRLRSLPITARLPVLILSARAAPADKDKGFAVGANGYLTKPVRFPDLLSELRRLLSTAMPHPPETPDKSTRETGYSGPSASKAT